MLSLPPLFHCYIVWHFLKCFQSKNPTSRKRHFWPKALFSSISNLRMRSQMFCFRPQCLQNTTFEKPCMRPLTWLYMTRNPRLKYRKQFINIRRKVLRWWNELFKASALNVLICFVSIPTEGRDAEPDFCQARPIFNSKASKMVTKGQINSEWI